jgi:PAS domain S-box-containing protein
MTKPLSFIRNLWVSRNGPADLVLNCLGSLPMAAFVADSEGRLLAANPRFFQLWGRAESEGMEGWAWKDRIQEEDRRIFEQQWQKAIAGGGDFAQRFRLQSKEGERVIWIELRAQVRLPAHDDPLSVTVLAEDVSQRVYSEQREGWDHQMLTAILDSSPDLIFVKDAECRYMVGNRAHLKRMGKSSVSEIFGKTVFDFFPEERAKQAYAAEKVIIESGVPVLNLREDDEGKSYLSNKVPFRDEEGRVLGFVGISRDITDLRQAQIALEQAKEEAEAGTRAKSEFLANMSHEIRTPMNAVIGMTGLLLDTSLTHEQRDFVETIRNSGDSLLSIINDILDFSKIESGKIELESQPVDLRNCIEESLDLLSGQASKKGLDLVYLVHEPCPAALLGDVTRLRQVLVNLVSNAVKFTPKGEVFVQVSAEPLGRGKHRFHFAVKDTGIGIKPEKMARLFQSFSQVDASTTRQFGGTGLGLAISRRLCQLMGGDLWCESEYGRGSTFHFTVEADVAQGQPRVFLRSAQPQLDGRSVLIVDDNPTNRQILTLQTKSWGMVPAAASSGEEALEWLQEGRKFDVALLDWHMPEMDGLTLARKLQTDEHTCTLPLVMLTSRATRSLATEGIKFEAHLTKPVKPSQLFDVLIQHFSREGKLVDGGTGEKRSSRAGGSRKKILLAEDNAINQKVALLTLQKLGHDIHVASNGLEVLDALKKENYDIILMDVQMPEMDGLEATRRIREEFKGAARPWIIAMTANAMVEDREICLSAGMDDYLSKPVKLEAIEDALSRARVIGNES